MTYNGWINYETWAVKLWLDNEETLYRYWGEQTEDCVTAATDEDQAVRDLEQRLKQEHEDALPELTGFAADLLNAAMSEVDWREMAEDMVRDWIADNEQPEDWPEAV